MKKNEIFIDFEIRFLSKFQSRWIIDFEKNTKMKKLQQWLPSWALPSGPLPTLLQSWTDAVSEAQLVGYIHSGLIHGQECKLTHCMRDGFAQICVAPKPHSILLHAGFKMSGTQWMNRCIGIPTSKSGIEWQFVSITSVILMVCVCQERYSE